MATSRQRSAARRNIKKAAKAARRKRTVAHLPKKTRTALVKKVRRLRRESDELKAERTQRARIHCTRMNNVSQSK